jgi:hypothetical protein
LVNQISIGLLRMTCNNTYRKAPTRESTSRYIKVLKTSKGNDFRVLPAMGSNGKNPSNSAICGIFLYFQHLCGPACVHKVVAFKYYCKSFSYMTLGFIVRRVRRKSLVRSWYTSPPKSAIKHQRLRQIKMRNYLI